VNFNNLEGYLDKFKKIFSTVNFQRDAVVSIIEKHTNIKLLPKEFDIKDFVVTLKTSPGIKNEIFMHRNQILEELKTVLGNQSPKNIR
jgi:hypothetical protein